MMHWIWRRKTILRSLFNEALSCKKLSGRVLDIGGTKNPAPSYMEVLHIEGEVQVVNIDTDAHPDIVANAEALPLEDASFDHVLCFNLLEHVSRPERVAREMTRVLRSGGTAIVAMPFLVKVHGHPQDFRRLTGSALQELMQEAGLRVDSIVELGGGPFLAGIAQIQAFTPLILFIPLLFGARFFDYLLSLVRPQYMRDWPLGYLLCCSKL